MSDCCSTSAGFPSASNMQQLAANLPVVWEEICYIQQAILAASSQCQPGGGKMCTTVSGTSPMTFVTGIESVTVVNGGSGYIQDSPTVRFIPPVGSSATGATGTITTNGGSILSINVINGSTGYQPISATMSVSSISGTNAELVPLVNSVGNIVGVNIINSGVGYTLNDTVTATRAVLSNPAYVNASFRIISVGVLGEILSVAITNQGSGYQPSVTTVEVVSTANPAMLYPLGAGLVSTVLTDVAGTITQVLVNSGGNGYGVFPPYLVISDPGTGATTSVTLSGTSVASIVVNSPGTSYTTNATGAVMNPPTIAPPNPPSSSAVVTITTSVNTFGTDPLLYWQVWAGVATNKAIQMQMSTVLSYFTSLGYTVSILSNPSTNNTIMWRICW